MTATYWAIGQRIVQHEQTGRARAGYGAQLLTQLSVDLTSRFERGFGLTNRKQFRKYYRLWQSTGRDLGNASPRRLELLLATTGYFF